MKIVVYKEEGRQYVWESGGATTAKGKAVIVADANGEPKVPVKIKKHGHVSNKDHALFTLEEGDHIVTANRHKTDIKVDIYVFKDNELAIIQKIRDGHWEYTLLITLPGIHAAIAAAKKKASMYHCREAVYIKE